MVYLHSEFSYILIFCVSAIFLQYEGLPFGFLKADLLVINFPIFCWYGKKINLHLKRTGFLKVTLLFDSFNSSEFPYMSPISFLAGTLMRQLFVVSRRPMSKWLSFKLSRFFSFLAFTNVPEFIHLWMHPRRSY